MDDTDRRLLDRLQESLPLVPRPFAVVARDLGLDEAEVLGRLTALHERGLVRRVGPVLDPAKVGRIGVLAAMAVPPGRIETVAAQVSACDRVTHNYERKPLRGECPYTLWFTLTATSQEGLREAIDGVAQATGLPVTTFPVGRKFKIGVRFPLSDETRNG